MEKDSKNKEVYKIEINWLTKEQYKIIWALLADKSTNGGYELAMNGGLAELSHESGWLNKPDVIKSVCEICDGKGEYYKPIPNGRVLVDCDCKKQTVL